jgi:hypothetical protein
MAVANLLIIDDVLADDCLMQSSKAFQMEALAGLIWFGGQPLSRQFGQHSLRSGNTPNTLDPMSFAPVFLSLVAEPFHIPRVDPLAEAPELSHFSRSRPKRNAEANIMTVRSRDTTVTFRHPFTMPSVEGCQPAGTYRLVTDEDEVAVVPFAITRRIATHLHTPALSLQPAVGNVFTITPAELSMAIEADRQRDALSVLDESLSQDLEIRL